MSISLYCTFIVTRKMLLLIAPWQNYIERDIYVFKSRFMCVIPESLEILSVSIS